MLIPGMSYWDTYMLPVQVRRYMVGKYMEMQEARNNPVDQKERNDAGLQAIAKKIQQNQVNPPPNYLANTQR